MSVYTLLHPSHSIWAASSFVSAWLVVTALGVMSFVVCCGYIVACCCVYPRVCRELFVTPKQRCGGGRRGWEFRVDPELRSRATWHHSAPRCNDDPDILSRWSCCDFSVSLLMGGCMHNWFFIFFLTKVIIKTSDGAVWKSKLDHFQAKAVHFNLWTRNVLRG